MKRKLVIYDPQWSAYAGLFSRRLGDDWEVVSDLNGIPDLLRELPGADALLALALPLQARAAARNLKVFVYPGAGIARTDPQEYPAGCAVVNVYEHGSAIAEYVMAVILLHVTQIQRYAASFRAGSWEGSGRTGGATHEEASGKTLGLIGYGNIGQAVARRAVAFDMRVIAVSEDLALPPDAPRPHYFGLPDALPTILGESDFLVVACPLTPRTRNMLGAPELACLKPSAYLINVSRAEIIDETALFEALRDRRIAGAALDVWYRYPHKTGMKMTGSRLPFHELPNVLATPHMAGWTSAMVERRIARIAENLKRLEYGEPFERVVFTGAWRPRDEAQ